LIPSSVTTVNAQAFASAILLEKLTLSENLEIIGYKSFYASRSLKELYLPSSVTTIGERAFLSSGLNKFVFMKEMTMESIDTISIGENAFC